MPVKPLRIGPVEVRPPLVLAPMSGVTNRTLRALYKPFGFGLTVTEFVSSNALQYGNQRTMEMIDQHGVERPVSTQLWGNDPAIMALCGHRRARMRRRHRRHQLRLPGAEGHQDRGRKRLPARRGPLRCDHARGRRRRRLPGHGQDAPRLERGRDSCTSRSPNAPQAVGISALTLARAYGEAILSREARLGAHRRAQARVSTSR